MGEFDLLVFTFIGFLETCKDDQLKTFGKMNYSNLNLAQKFSLDEAKILKRAIKLYRSSNSNPVISNMIINYFNSK